MDEERRPPLLSRITIAADPESNTDPRVKSAFFIVEQSGEQLTALGKLFLSGELRAFVKAELPMEETDRAYRGAIASHSGKVANPTQAG